MRTLTQSDEQSCAHFDAVSAAPRYRRCAIARLLSSAAAHRRNFLQPLFAGDDSAVPVPPRVPTVYEGMSTLAADRVNRSIALFDAIAADDPEQTARLWPRGIALYYAGRYWEAADQFAALRPNDGDVRIWRGAVPGAAGGGGGRRRPIDGYYTAQERVFTKKDLVH